MNIPPRTLVGSTRTAAVAMALAGALAVAAAPPTPAAAATAPAAVTAAVSPATAAAAPLDSPGAGVRVWSTPPPGWVTPGHPRTARPPVSRTAARSAATVMALRPVLARWWGLEIVLRARIVSRINKAITAGAGIATVASVLAAAGVISSPGAIPTAAVAAVLTLGRAALELCNWNNRGVRLFIPRLAPVATCWAR